MTTNVKAKELNYDKYENEKYDNDIYRVIPGYEKLHEEIEKAVRDFSKKNKVKKIADIGVGTGITSEKILRIIPKAELTAVDFSSTMLSGAKKRLAKYKTKFILGDYTKANFGVGLDIIVSVIGLHHQDDEGKKKMFKKICASLHNKGLFVFADLVTYNNKYEAALNEAKHYSFLVDHASDEKSLMEWAYHHKFLNSLAPIDDQIDWLKEAGFSSLKIKFKKFNTVLILARK